MVYLVWCTAFELRHQTQMEWHFYECAFFALLLKSIRKDDFKEQRTKDYDFFVCIFFVVHQYRYWSLCKLIHTFMMFYYCRCITKMTKSNRIFFVLPQKIHYFAYFTLNDEDIEKKGIWEVEWMTIFRISLSIYIQESSRSWMHVYHSGELAESKFQSIARSVSHCHNQRSLHRALNLLQKIRDLQAFVWKNKAKTNWEHAMNRLFICLLKMKPKQ